jgi:lytic murein transglycosylase
MDPIRPILAAICLTLLLGDPVHAACQTSGSFDAWLAGFKRQAVAAGISERAVGVALAGVTFDPGVIKKDRSQAVFKQSFEQFSASRVNPRLRKAEALLNQHRALFSQLEGRYGVPGAVLVAIWGLETDFGAVRGNLSTIRSLATLAYDCRRSEFFTGELLAAIRIVERGDLTPGQMRGGWAGEIGQAQFLPSSYLKYAVDGDGNGKRDLINSSADALASTANYLKGYGWRAGQPWGEGTANFEVIRQWNKASVYSRTIAYFATRLATGG